MNDIHIQRKILDILFKDWIKWGGKPNYNGLGPMHFVGRVGSIETTVRCLKLLIGLGYVDGSGESQWKDMLWEYVWLTSNGTFLCQHPDKLDEQFPKGYEPEEQKGEKMKLSPSTKILLTGAGFTKNFGGFLGKDMWYEIFNHNAVGKEKRVKKLMQSSPDYNFETIYQTITGGKKYTENEKKVIHDAVMEAYENLDYIVKEWRFTNNSPHPINIHLLSEMISRFADNNTQGYFFTLNQDLFIERKYSGRNLCSSLGIRWEPRFIRNNMRDLELSENEFLRLPNSDELNEKKEESLSGCRFVYIKLHGSYGWLSFEGSHKLVIGGGKLTQIEKEPLLNWYYGLFKEVLGRDNQKLLIIGYGFGDTHINEVIWEAVNKRNLQIFIISPQDYPDFEKIMHDCPHGKELLQGIEKYYHNDLKEIFPPDQSVSIYYKTIKKDFFELNIR